MREQHPVTPGPELRASSGSVEVVTGPELTQLLTDRLVDVPDWPQPGVVFKDITPLLADPVAFRSAIAAMVQLQQEPFDLVVGIEARGFMLAAAVAYAAGVGVVPVRKAGKLPRATHSSSYTLEYGEATLEVHQDAFHPGQRVLVIDDVLATGGTAQTTLELIERTGARVVSLTVLIELTFLAGREKITKHPVHTILTV
jgi:adenine phosphoribosyltransferase